MSHDSKDAILELNNSLTYLDQADAIAGPELEARINNLINNIKDLISLTESIKQSWKKDELIDSLDRAAGNITKAESVASLPTKLRLKPIEQNIQQLKLDLQKTSIKTRYDSIMADFIRTINNIYKCFESIRHKSMGTGPQNLYR